VTILRSLDSANARRPVPLMKAKGSSRGDPHLPDFLKDAPELRRWHEAHGSISIQEGQPHTSLILPGIFSFRTSQNSRENSVP
jgi:hypothetical protein